VVYERAWHDRYDRKIDLGILFSRINRRIKPDKLVFDSQHVSLLMVNTNRTMGKY